MPHATNIQTTPPPRPMVFVALAHLAGLAAGLACPAPPDGFWRWLALALWFLALAAGLGWTGWRLWRSRRIHGPPDGAGWGLLLALALAGWWQGAAVTAGDRLAERQVEPWLNGDLVSIEGIVAGEPRVKPDGVDLTLGQVRVEALRVNGGTARLNQRVRVTLREEAAATLHERPDLLPLPGQRVRAWGTLRQVLDQTTPGTFNPRQYWLSQDVGSRLAVARAADLELGVRPDGPRAMIHAGLRGLRQQVAATFHRRLPADQAPVARALFLGEGHLIEAEDREAFNQTSLTHLLAVSGLHTGFVLLFIYFVTYGCGLSPRASAWTGMAGLILYMGLTGFAPPVARATFMGVFLLAGYAMWRVVTAPASLATAMFASLLLDPRNLLRLDWQLSYGCAAAIVLCAPPIYELLAFRQRGRQSPPANHEPLAWHWRALNKYLVLPLAVTVAIQLILLPIQVAYFRQYNALSPVFNIAGVDLTLLLMFGVILTALLGWVPGVGWLLGHGTACLMRVFEGFVHWAGSLSDAVILVSPLPLWLLAAYYGLVLGGSWLRTGEADNLRLGRRQKAGLALALGMLGLFLAWAPLLGRLDRGGA